MTPFYKKALALFTNTQEAQIKKGLAKYTEPFNPHHWTPEELLNHALEETVDLTHYLVGLKELLDAKDKEIEKYKNRCLDYERKLNKADYDLNYQPIVKYSDQDHQY
jgi:phosphopantetheine adenylyltransferase